MFAWLQKLSSDDKQLSIIMMQRSRVNSLDTIPFTRK